MTVTRPARYKRHVPKRLALPLAPALGAIAVSLVAASLGCVKPQYGSVSGGWCKPAATTLDDFEDGDANLCMGFPGTWAALTTGSATISRPAPGTPLEPIMTSDFDTEITASDGGATAEGEAGVDNISGHVLAVSGLYTDQATGAIGVEATFLPPIDLTPYAALSYRIYANAADATGTSEKILENVNFTCDGCAGVGCTPVGGHSLDPGVWTLRTSDLTSGPDCMGTGTVSSLMTVSSLQIRVDGMTNSLLAGSTLTLAIDDVAVVPRSP
ncbi:MAG TPA: hypothetical protein VMU50_23460 [Polyangia bacterium]|nr:hypothetical protein [Polyangia bacterium]